MKSKIKLKLKLYLLLLVLLMINQSNCYAQVNTLDDKNALLFWMKVNNFSLDDQFFRSYLEITKGREYKLYQNDEFGYSKFYNNSKIEYSIMNLPSQTDPNNLVLYIHNITIYDDSGILSVITPREDYYDKVNGLKLKDGTEKIFFDINWKELQKGDSLGASFYRIINYKEGKIYNPVIDYYIRGIINFAFFVIDNSVKACS